MKIKTQQSCWYFYCAKVKDNTATILASNITSSVNYFFSFVLLCIKKEKAIKWYVSMHIYKALISSVSRFSEHQVNKFLF